MKMVRMIVGWLCAGLAATALMALVTLCVCATRELRAQGYLWQEHDVLRAGIHVCVVVIVPTAAALLSLVLAPTRAWGLVVRWCLMLQVVLALDLAVFAMVRTMHVSVLVGELGKMEQVEIARMAQVEEPSCNAFGLLTTDDPGLPAADAVSARMARMSAMPEQLYQSRLGLHMARYLGTWTPTTVALVWLQLSSVIMLATIGVIALARKAAGCGAGLARSSSEQTP